MGIGAVITAAVLIATFFAFDTFSDQKELVIEHSPKIQETGPPKVTMKTFLENGSPILGDPNAPITLVEYGDYQCHFCNVFFHNTEESILKNYVETGKVKMKKLRNMHNRTIIERENAYMYQLDHEPKEGTIDLF